MTSVSSNASSVPLERNYHNGMVTVLSFCKLGVSTDKVTSPDLGMRYAVFHDYDGVQPPCVVFDSLAASPTVKSWDLQNE
jgi:hypothetical protein